MPDATRSSDTAPAPRDWSEAFAALPMETPPADAWPALSRRIEARRRARLPAWLGLAAAAAVVAIVLWPRTAVDLADGANSLVGATQVASPAGGNSPEHREPARSVAASAAPTGAPASEGPRAAAGPTGGRLPDTSQPARADSTPQTQPTLARLYGLQQESARLEALLAAARDERVGSASALLLADAFDAQVATIDAALTAPALDDAQRESLWQARVEALQQAAGFVGTRRLLATQGHADALLVSVD